MDIRGKIGQRLVFGFPGTTIPAEFAVFRLDRRRDHAAFCCW